MSKLHIVMPVLNAIEYTKTAYESIKTKQNFQFHLVDQESSDGTQAWGEEMAKHKRFWYHRFDPRVSLSEAWNTGIIESFRDDRCKYVLVTNNDVLFHRLTIDAMIKAMERSNYAMVTGDNVAPTYQGRIDEFYKHKVDKSSEEFDHTPITDWRAEGPDFSCFLISRQTIRDVGFFDENFNPAYKEDWDYHIRMFLAGKNSKRFTTAPYYHYGSMTVRVNPSLGLGSHRTTGYFAKKWGVFEHSEIMDRKSGYRTQYGLGDKDIKYWDGCGKYLDIKI